MEKHQFEEKVKRLSEIKEEWNTKYNEMYEYLEKYQPISDVDINEVQEKINMFQNDLNKIGFDYNEAMKNIVKTMDKEANDIVISQLCNQVVDNIDYDYATYLGDRESKLRDINDIIEKNKQVVSKQNKMPRQFD